jgi:hypothetical protein
MNSCFNQIHNALDCPIGMLASKQAIQVIHNEDFTAKEKICFGFFFSGDPTEPKFIHQP